MATKIDSSPPLMHSATISNPLESIAERRWMTLGVLIATILVWIQVSNPVAWMGFLALIAGVLGWILYGNARASRSVAGAVGVSAACLAGLIAFGSLAAVALSYADRTGAPAGVFVVIGAVVLAAVAVAAWRIVAPLRTTTGR